MQKKSGNKVHILGGGPSLIRLFGIPEQIEQEVREGITTPSAYSSFMSHLHDENVIGVNVAYQLGNWVDYCFFGDAGFYTISSEKLKRYEGRVYSCHRKFQSHDRVRYIAQERNKMYGLSHNGHTICWNKNSGAAAIDFAVKLGFTEIVLIGYDTECDDNGNVHWHNEYKLTNKPGHDRKGRKELMYNVFKHSLTHVVQDAVEKGINLYKLDEDMQLSPYQLK